LFGHPSNAWRCSDVKLKLRFFAALRERVGVAELEVECPEGITVEALRRDLLARYGASAGFGTKIFVAVNWDPGEATQTLHEGDEVAFLPPMSGGSDPEGSFWISEAPIDAAMVEKKVRAAGCGGIVTFVGTVRDMSREKPIRCLEYEAYPGMAEKRMRAIGGEVAARWPGARVAMAHRVGRLAIGEVAVAISVAAPHRDEAFRACRYAIDRLKETVPIWKKEFTMEGGEWVDPQP
jgi:molybdopterin converting factor subunit 1